MKKVFLKNSGLMIFPNSSVLCSAVDRSVKRSVCINYYLTRLNGAELTLNMLFCWSRRIPDMCQRFERAECENGHLAS